MVRVLAQWEPRAATWMQWPEDSEADMRPAFADIIGVIQAYEPVHLLTSSEARKAEARRLLAEKDIPEENITWYMVPIDSAWMRDNGPIYVTDGERTWIEDFRFNAWGGNFGADVPHQNMDDKLADIAYCGLYCGDCPAHTGAIADLARDLRKELRTFRYEKTAATLAEMPYFSAFRKYDACYEVLGAMVKLRCGKACRDGGGNPYCPIRKCATKREYVGCWQCDDFEDCERFVFLEGNHGIAHIKNLRALQRKGVEGFLEGRKAWYVKPPDRR